MSLSVHAITGLPSIVPGDDLGDLLLAAIEASGDVLRDGDVLVVCQKVVSKAEGRVVDLSDIAPSPFAREVATQGNGKDPRLVEVVLRESRRIVRMDRGHLIVETGAGWVCANAGVDQSNTGDPDRVVLLPEDADRSARQLRDAARARMGGEIAVIVSDTFGRPWREGQIDVALGVAGMEPLLDLRGSRDLDGRELRHTVLADADALAAAAGLVMHKAAGIAAAIVRGYGVRRGDGNGRDLIRPAEADLFR